MRHSLRARFLVRSLVCLLAVTSVSRSVKGNSESSSGHGAPEAQAGEHGEPAKVAEEAVEEEATAEEPGTLYIHDSPEEILIPSKIWDLIYTEEKSKPRVVFVPVKLQMKERNSGILSQSEVNIQFPRGGGEVDLARFVTEKRGSFYVKFSFEQGHSAESSYVYFVSRNRKRKMDGLILGSGCKSFFDVKSYLGKVDKDGGVLVNTTRLRHLSVLGGTFVFANVTGKEVRLSQVSFKDSKNPQYFCESSKKLKSKNGESPNGSAEGL